MKKGKQKNKKRDGLLSLESRTFTNGFNKAAGFAARRIHTLIAKSRRPS